MTDQEKELKRIVDLLEFHLGDSDNYLPEEPMTPSEFEEEYPVVAAMQIAVKLMLDARSAPTQGADAFFDVQAATFLPDGTVSVHGDVTQGADARPVAIYQIEQAPKRWTDVSRETYEAWAFGKQIVYATRDAAPSDGPEVPWSKVMELAEKHGKGWSQYSGWAFLNDDRLFAFAKAIAAIAPRNET